MKLKIVEIIKSLARLQNQYQLRWLFYRNKPNFDMGKNNYTAANRCIKCKRGVSVVMGVFFNGKYTKYCPHCGEEWTGEKNTSIRHYLWNKREILWNILDYLHICRNTVGGRYDYGNEEKYLIQHYEFDSDWNFEKLKLRKRKWWEYLIIKK